LRRLFIDLITAPMTSIPQVVEIDFSAAGRDAAFLQQLVWQSLRACARHPRVTPTLEKAMARGPFQYAGTGCTD
jgi:hypothetical protein